MISTVLTVVQMILAVLLVLVVLLQQKGAGLGAAFGGSNTMFSSRRGADLVLYRATIAISILFFATSLAIVIVG